MTTTPKIIERFFRDFTRRSTNENMRLCSKEFGKSAETLFASARNEAVKAQKLLDAFHRTGGSTLKAAERAMARAIDYHMDGLQYLTFMRIIAQIIGDAIGGGIPQKLSEHIAELEQSMKAYSFGLVPILGLYAEAYSKRHMVAAGVRFVNHPPMEETNERTDQ